MKKFTSLNLLLLILIILLPAISFSKAERQKGLINTTIDELVKANELSLIGEYEFYWKQLLTPDDFNKKVKPQLTGYYKFPKKWSKFKVGTTQLSSMGYATYRFKINLDKAKQELTLKIPELLSSFKLFIDGKMYKEWGKVGTDSKDTLPRRGDARINFKSKSKTVEIILQQSNYERRDGGSWMPLTLSLTETSQSSTKFTFLADGLLIGSILIMAIYHFTLFLLRHEDRSSLAFAAFCIATVLRTSYSGDGELAFSFAPWVNWEWAIRFEYLGFFLMTVTCFWFSNTLFKREISKYIRWIVYSFSAVYIAMNILTPTLFFTKIVGIYHLIWLIMCISIIVAPIIGIVRKKEGSVIFLIGLVVLFLANLNDMLVARALIYSVSLGQFGLFIFIFAQSYLLSRMFSNAFVQIEIDEKKIRVMHDELIEKERARTLFFHNASHELRTPLTGIIGFLEIFSSGHYGTINQKMKSQLGKITNLSNSLLHQINAILDLAKAKKDEGLQLISSSIALNELSQEIINLSEGLAQKSDGTTFKCKTSWGENEKPTFINDGDKIFTILRNLVGNSFKFKSKNRDNEIDLTLDHLDKELIITITDTGCGIPEEDHERIFVEFEQVEKETNRAHEGTGLGLALIKKFVTLMNGTIELKSVVETGSTFKIVIPEQDEVSLVDTSKPASMKNKIKEDELLDDISSEEDTAAQAPASSAESEDPTTSDKAVEFLKASKKGLSILIVDDNETILEVVEDVLSNNNYLTTIAPGGEYALEEIKESKPDLILLDLMMPQVSGEDVLKYVKGNEEYKDIPVILLTARASHEDKIFGLQLGADDYLSKPIDFNELLLRVKNTLNRTDLVRTMEQLIHREKMAQVGDLMSEFSHEIKNLTLQNQIDPNARLNKISAVLKTFDYPEPNWGTVINALNKDSVTISSQNKRQETFDNFPVNTKCVKDLRFMSIVLKTLSVDDDIIFDIWKAISESEPEQVTLLRNIVEISTSLLILDSSSKRTHDLAVTILNFSRSKAISESFAIYNLISDCISLLKSKINRASIHVNIKLDDTNLIYANKSEIHQIVLNLLVNAADALAETKNETNELTIDFKDEDNDLTIIFEDNGGGIPQDIMDNIFTKDFSTKGDKGSGIGLFVSRNLANKNKGALAVRSDNGRTYFELRVPKNEPTVAKDVSEEATLESAQ